MAWHLIETQASGEDMAMKKAVWTQGLRCSFLEEATLQQRCKLGGRGQRAGAEAGGRALLFPAVSLCHANMTWPMHIQPGQQAWKELLRLFTKMNDDLR